MSDSLPDRSQFRHWFETDVRWGDMDALGHVNNAAYFTYFESGRISYFEAVDLWGRRAHDRQGPALVKTSCTFKKQVHYPATLDVGVRVSRVGARSFTMEYAVYDKQELVAYGDGVVAWADYDEERSVPLPEGLVRAIEAIEEECT